MTLIKIVNKDAVTIPVLFRLALKRIHDEKNMSHKEVTELEESLVNWHNHMEVRRDLGFNAVDEENQMALEIIGSLLLQNEQGKLERRKELFKKCGIDYRKFYRLPEAYKPEDFLKAKHEHSLLPPEEQ